MWDVMVDIMGRSDAAGVCSSVAERIQIFDHVAFF